MKRCITCGIEKEHAQFSPRKNPNSTGTKYWHPECKRCACDRMKKWRLDNLERFQEYQRKHYHEHK